MRSFYSLGTPLHRLFQWMLSLSAQNTYSWFLRHCLNCCACFCPSRSHWGSCQWDLGFCLFCHRLLVEVRRLSVVLVWGILKGNINHRNNFDKTSYSLHPLFHPVYTLSSSQLLFSLPLFESSETFLEPTTVPYHVLSVSPFVWSPTHLRGALFCHHYSESTWIVIECD